MARQKKERKSRRERRWSRPRQAANVQNARQSEVYIWFGYMAQYMAGERTNMASSSSSICEQQAAYGDNRHGARHGTSVIQGKAALQLLLRRARMLRRGRHGEPLTG